MYIVTAEELAGVVTYLVAVFGSKFVNQLPNPLKNLGFLLVESGSRPLRQPIKIKPLFIGGFFFFKAATLPSSHPRLGFKG